MHTYVACDGKERSKLISLQKVVSQIMLFHFNEQIRIREGYEGGLYISKDGGTMAPTEDDLYSDKENEWSYASAILFTATILTTIGG